MSKEILEGSAIGRFADELERIIFPYQRQPLEEIKPRAIYFGKSFFPSQETRDKAMNAIRQKE